MQAEKKLTEIIWDNKVEKFYSTEANFFRYGALVTIFAFSKWYIGLSAFTALIPAIAGSTLLFGLFMNRIKNVAASLLFFVLTMGYVHAIPFLLNNQPILSFLNPVHFSGVVDWGLWFLITLVVLGFSTIIGHIFFNFQLPYSFHQPLLYLVIVAGYGCYYAFAGSWLLLIAWIFGNVAGCVEFLLTIGVIIALFKAKQKSQNIAWDIYIARNKFAFMFKNDKQKIEDALPSALENEKDITSMLTLAMKYAQCNGVVRNPQQCIRWCNQILKYLESSSPGAHLINIKNSNMELYLSHMLLYIVYSRSTQYKNVSKAEKHKKSFDTNLINNISSYWLHWSDPNCPFEDISEYRFWGLPYKKLQKIANDNPDAYLTLCLYCSNSSEYCSKDSQLHRELEELQNEYMNLGLSKGSKACFDFIKDITK